MEIPVMRYRSIHYALTTPKGMALKEMIVPASSQTNNETFHDFLSKKNDTVGVNNDINSKNSLKEETFQCEICHFVFYNEILYNNHKKQHKKVTCEDIVDMKNNTKTCELCGEILQNYLLYRKHKSNHRSRQCDICEKTFRTFRNIRRHKMLVHSDESEYYTCKICGKLLKTESYLEKHMQTVHATDKKTFSCDICNKIFSWESTLNSHKRYVHCDSKDRRGCAQCNKSFKNESTLVDHMKRVHLNLNYRMCEICGVKVKGSITTHMAFVHGEPVPCSICGKNFSCKKSLLYHQKHTHTNERNWTCETCGKSFKTQSILYKHGMVHSSERKYTCDICLKTFKFKNVLQTHQRVHTNIDPYVCSNCHVSFKWKQTYDRHIESCSQSNN